MAEHRQLRLHEVRNVYRLVNRCLELGEDPLAWRQRMLEGLLAMLDGSAGLLLEVADAEQQSNDARKPIGSIVGDHGGVARLFQERILPDGHFQLQMEVGSACESCGATHQSWCAELTNGRCPKHDGPNNRPVHVNSCPDLLCGTMPMLADGYVYVVIAPRSTDYTNRSARLFHLFLEEMSFHFPWRLASLQQPTVVSLPPRLRQVLTHLHEGESEKQAAQQLDISIHTLHQHVKRLHEKLNVSSRGQLMAASQGLLPVLRYFDRAGLHACHNHHVADWIESRHASN